MNLFKTGFAWGKEMEVVTKGDTHIESYINIICIMYIYISIHSKKYIILKQPENDERKMDTRHLKTCTLFFLRCFFFVPEKGP